MFRMNGQVLCSRQTLSTYIHVSNSAVPWTIFCSRQQLLRCSIKYIPVLAAKIAFPPSMAVMPRSAYVQDERSVFMLPANLKYLHPCEQ
jgi:hypothetical protein